MAFTYPHALVEGILRTWDAFQAPRDKQLLNRPDIPEGVQVLTPDPPPRPNLEQVRAMLDVTYHASFLVEEGRRVAVRVAFLPAGADLQRVSINFHDSPIRFTMPFAFTVSEVLRLAPAIEPSTSILLVGPPLENADSSELEIWGVIHTGSEFASALKGTATGALAPPNCLTVTTLAPGTVTVSTLGLVIVRLRGGQVVRPVLPSVSAGGIGAFLRPTAELLYREACAALKVERYFPERDSDRHPYQQYYGTFDNILAMTRDRRHGGTFVVMPDELTSADDRLRDRLTIKYPVAGVELWKLVVDECVANHNYFARLYPEANSFRSLVEYENVAPEQLKALMNWESRSEGARRRLVDKQHLIATFAGVDGAVVLTNRLRVLGFGAEITAVSHITHVKIAANEDATVRDERPITSFGTRHRSAFRLCSSFENCVCFVVSQDGGVRAVKRLGPDVIMWPDVTLGSMTL